MYTSTDILFVIATPPGSPMAWLGTVSATFYETWFAGKGALQMMNVRGMNYQANPSTNQVMAAIGSPYIGDTPQKSIAVFPTSVEILGVVQADGQACSDNNRLYQTYLGALRQWQSALSNIAIVGPGDMPKSGNVLPGNFRK